MGHLVDGTWHTGWYEPDAHGAFQRPAARFRRRPEAIVPGRYHLYAAWACPWAHRTLITRSLRGLVGAISVTMVDPHMGDDGWVFRADDPDPIGGAQLLRDVYLRADHGYTGRVTVPVLWDKQTRSIVNNESAEIIRMLNSEFEEFADRSVNLSPAELLPEIDAINAEVYDRVNNGVYKAGFATDQAVYEEAVTRLFETLERLEAHLSVHRWLVGDRLTEADIRLFTTLLRFDPVYHGHFKCNLRPLHKYPALWGFTREIAQRPGVAATIEMTHIKRHYYESHHTINPTGIVPKGPVLDLAAPHGRERLPEAE
jgi:putative glutathione S-transferase